MNNENEMRAKQLLRFFMRRAFQAAGAAWDAETALEVDNIVPAILDAMDERIALAVDKALTRNPAGRADLVLTSKNIIRLADIERINPAGDGNGGYCVHLRSGKTATLDADTGTRLALILAAQAIDLRDPTTKPQPEDE